MTTALEQLKQPLDVKRVRQRSGAGGKSLSYLETHDVIGHLNASFGFDGWSDIVMEFSQVPCDKGAMFRCAVCLEVRFDERTITRTGIGIGVARSGAMEELEKAQKEAESDALKRAARTLGDQFGNSLYEKDAPEHKGEQRARLATHDQLTECETLRGQAVACGFLTPKNTVPQIARDGSEERAVLGKISAYRAWIQEHGDKGAPAPNAPAGPPAHADRWAAINAAAQGFKGYLDFITLCQKRGIPWTSDDDVRAFEDAATAKTGFPIVAEELGENDWAEWATMVSGEEVKWG